jgi:short-subunit dehydrogenase
MVASSGYIAAKHLRSLMPRSIVITGASSGIGKALAQRFARPGTTLGILGRDEQRLTAVAVECRQRGAQVSTALVDVCARETMSAWLTKFDDASPIDLLVVNAGIMGGSLPNEDIERPEISLAVFDTNVHGVINTIHPIVPRMIARGSGQIAILSSMAGFVPLPDAPSYAASKAAVLSYGLALRSLLYDKGIKVNVVCPGYVSTLMTGQESGWKPFEMAPEQAAELILRGLERDKSIITFPRLLSLVTRIGALLPERIHRWTSKPFRFKVKPRD